MTKRPDLISTTKASSHRLAPFRIYTATVDAVNSAGQVNISIPGIKSKYGPVMPLGVTNLNVLKVGDSVKCMFSDEYFNEIVVFGPSIKKPDVFADKLVVDDLLVQVASLETRVAALEAQISSIGSSIASIGSSVAALEAE